MIGIVVVSHSRELAEATVALASQMLSTDSALSIEIAAGLDDGSFGTDAMAISEAVTAANSGDGVFVLLDLGSALLSTEMALEFVDPDIAEAVEVSSAPLVEGLVAAVVPASAGASLGQVAAEAANALTAKQQHLGHQATTNTQTGSSEAQAVSDLSATVHWQHPITLPSGMHARPVGKFASTASTFEVEIQVSNSTTGSGPVSGSSPTQLATLGLLQGHTMTVQISGPDAARALAAMATLASEDFGDALPTVDETSTSIVGHENSVIDTPAHTTASPATITGVLNRSSAGSWPPVLSATQPTQDGSPSTLPKEAATEQLKEAIGQVEGFLSRIAADNPDCDDIFKAQRALLTDPYLLRSIRTRFTSTTDEQTSHRQAIIDGVTQVATQFDQLADPHLRARGEDVRQLGRLLLTAFENETLQAPILQGVVALDELDALCAATATSDVAGFVVRSSAKTGHGTIIASQRGVLVLNGWHDTGSIDDGQQIRVDAEHNIVTVD